MREPTKSSRALKRPRAGDIQAMGSDSVKRVKRHGRLQDGNGEQSGQLTAPSAELDHLNDRGVGATDWVLSHTLAGQYGNFDPVFTLDEDYLFLGLETAVHAYSVTTSCLFRVLQLESEYRVIGYNLDPVDQSHLYVLYSDGSVMKWDWNSGKQIARWGGSSKALSADFVFYGRGSDTSPLAYSVRELDDQTREVVVLSLDNKELPEDVVLKSHSRISGLKVSREGSIAVVYGGSHIFIGTVNALQSGALEPVQRTWREVKLPSNITCLDIREKEDLRHSVPGKYGDSPGPIDLVLGQADGSILIYHDVVNFFLESNERRGALRRLHWHRGHVNAVRWSKDGNYIISSGNESVMVLWQLDTGRKQFLPHLPAPISNLVVSPSGSLYALKMADNSVMVLSARELQPHAIITGLQLRPTSNRLGDQTRKKIRQPLRAIAAALHPQHPDQLLVAIPAGDTFEGSLDLANSSILQTYDIRSSTHISRQAIARTNVTTLRINPEGLEIRTPNVTHLDLSQDGKWMATVDAWRQSPQDARDKSITDNLELFLKFWRWNNESRLWELATRIDGPHSLHGTAVPILGLEYRPYSREFVTLGADGILRFWCLTTRPRDGLGSGQDMKKQAGTWKCRSVVDMQGYIDSGKSRPLSTASIAFSDDGSVLSICLPTQSVSKPSLTLIIDAQKSVIHYSRIGICSGDLCAARFLGQHLVVVSSQAVSVWDTVNDMVQVAKLSDTDSAAPRSASHLLAVNSKTRTFAIATRYGLGSKPYDIEPHAQVYNIDLELLSQVNLVDFPLALLSDPRSGGYVIIDSAANLRKFGLLADTATTALPRDLPPILNITGFATQLGSQTKDGHVPSADTNSLLQPHAKGLAAVFDAPSFVLPPASVLFKDVVRAVMGH